MDYGFGGVIPYFITTNMVCRFGVFISHTHHLRLFGWRARTHALTVYFARAHMTLVDLPHPSPICCGFLRFAFEQLRSPLPPCLYPTRYPRACVCCSLRCYYHPLWRLPFDVPHDTTLFPRFVTSIAPTHVCPLRFDSGGAHVCLRLFPTLRDLPLPHRTYPFTHLRLVRGPVTF